MTITGNLAFASGAVYLVTINATSAVASANVDGTATLDRRHRATQLAARQPTRRHQLHDPRPRPAA